MMGKFVALLRGINVGGANKIAMADLRRHCAGLGWIGVETYIQSGNLVFAAAEGRAAKLEVRLEREIENRLGLRIPVIIRTAAEWRRLAAGNPFPEAAEKEPNRLMLLLSKKPPAKDAADMIQDRARAGERVARQGEALWIHYPQGAGKSKLSPALIDRLVGSPATSRNYRTVAKLGEMLKEMLTS
jgi:uncharacterized protein (DUF1697 family)